MDLRHNIFYSYRGPDTVGVDRDRQLENNLTKALINTLSLDGLRVFVNTELKSATDRLERVLKQSHAAFRAALQHLHAFEPFEHSEQWRHSACV